MEINCDVDSRTTLPLESLRKHSTAHLPIQYSTRYAAATRPAFGLFDANHNSSAQMIKSPAAEISCVGISYTPIGANEEV